MASELLNHALLIRMAATALVVIGVSWSVGALGPRIGGALAGLPMVLGPAFFFLARQAPAAFVAETAAYALLSLSATQLFLLAYMLSARRAGPLGALGCAVVVWALAALACRQLPPWPGLGLASFLIVTALTMRTSAAWVRPAPAPPRTAAPHVLLLRGALAGALVAAITTAAAWLGPASAGILLSFPVGYTVIATTVHETLGAASVIATLRAALMGGASLATFSVLMALLPARMPPLHAVFAAAVGSVCVTSLVVLRSTRRRAAA